MLNNCQLRCDVVVGDRTSDVFAFAQGDCSAQDCRAFGVSGERHKAVAGQAHFVQCDRGVGRDRLGRARSGGRSSNGEAEVIYSGSTAVVVGNNLNEG